MRGVFLLVRYSCTCHVMHESFYCSFDSHTNHRVAVTTALQCTLLSLPEKPTQLYKNSTLVLPILYSTRPLWGEGGCPPPDPVRQLSLHSTLYRTYPSRGQRVISDPPQILGPYVCRTLGAYWLLATQEVRAPTQPVNPPHPHLSKNISPGELSIPVHLTPQGGVF